MGARNVHAHQPDQQDTAETNWEARTMSMYRKKPAVIEARQWDGTAEGATVIIDWILSNGGTARYHEERWYDTSIKEETGETYSTRRDEPVPAHIAIDTLEGTVRTSPMDQVIKGVKNEFYPCKSDVFALTYEPA